jgi:hypothetical protein
MNGHSAKEHMSVANKKFIHNHPQDWHRAYKVRKVLFTF